MIPTPQQQLKRIAEVPIMGKYDEVLLPFKRLMENELHANAAKGDRPGWLSMTAEQCLLEIYYHVSKLQKAVRDGNGDRIKENTADVANMAMMLADICGALAMAQPSDGALTNEGAEPVMRLECEKLWDGQGEYAVDFVKPGWLEECRTKGGTFLLYTHPPAPASAAPATCTCPSGDGSLRWPCPVHPPEPVTLTAVAVLRDDGDGGLEPDWLLEGGTAELFDGMLLLVADNAPDLCEEDGSAELYRFAPASTEARS